MWQNSKSQIVTKLKNSNCDRTQKLKLWPNSKLKLGKNPNTQIVQKVKNANGDKTQKVKLCKFFKTLTTLKYSNRDKTQKLKLWPNSKLKLWQNSYCDKTPIVTKLKMWRNVAKLKLWQNARTQIMTKLKTQIWTKLEIWQISIFERKKNFKREF